MSSLGRDGAGDLKGGMAPLLPQPHDHERFSRGLRTGALICTLAVLWLTTRPYLGIVFDARLYIAEALRALDPQRFAQDLYFQFGSQGNFSLFTKLYLPLLPLFGVGATALLLLVAGQGLWLFGLVRLVRSLIGRQWLFLSLAMTIGMLHAYPGGLGYGENQLTPRLYAEAMVMLGLSLLATRPLWTGALLGLATAFHPLMALPGIAVALVYLALGRPLWWAAMAAGAGLVPLLALSGVAPFSNLFSSVDPEWFAIIRIRSMHCLLSDWPSGFFVQAAGVIVWSAAAVVVAGPNHRRFLLATFFVGVGGLVCAFLGGDLAHNLLMLQLQPWRSVWLMQLVSHIYMPLVISTVLFRTSFDNTRWTVLLGVTLILSSSVTRLTHHANPENLNFTLFSLALVAGASVVIAAQLIPEVQKHRTITAASLLTGLFLLFTALSQWDARTPWLKYVESSEPPPKDLTTLLPEGASVYWEDGLEMLWLRMRRSSYFSCDQGSGVLFYRETAIAYERRAKSIWPLRTADYTRLDNCAILDRTPKPERTRSGLKQLCVREPGLDYVVLIAPLDGLRPDGVWNSPVRFQEFITAAPHRPGSDSFYIYACNNVR